MLGIEAAGLVEDAPEGEFRKGDIVATAMGGMGRQFDGGYAEYTCAPAKQVQFIKTGLAWEILGAIPEMLQTSWGSLFKSLRLQKGERLLIQPGKEFFLVMRLTRLTMTWKRGSPRMWSKMGSTFR